MSTLDIASATTRPGRSSETCHERGHVSPFSRALLLRCVSSIGTSIGFYLPLSVVPLLAQESGSAAVAGLPTVALLLATVACELITPRLIGRIGYRCSMVVRLGLLGGRG